MASGKMSPRQKMINMMYLVLIALLALNVSKEMLKAFYLMEVSFVNSNKNVDIKNSDVLRIFDKNMETQAGKTKPWLDRATTVRKLSKEFCDYMEKLKADLAAMAEGRKEAEEGEDKKGLTELAQPDNMEKHANYFTVQQGGAKGKEVQKKINDTRIAMINVLNDPLVDKVAPGFRTELEKQTAFKAEDPKEKGEGAKHTWVSMYLEHAPLASVMAMLAKTENDCKNLEAEILNKLLIQINATDQKFTDVVAKVIAKSTNVLEGEPYEADIIVAAYNAKQDNPIFVNGSQIKVEEGIGKYKVNATEGEHKYNVEIEVPDPETGGKKRLKTEASFMGFKSSATISAEKMNVLYIGLDNPIKVSVPGFPPENVTPMMEGGGSLKPTSSKGSYIADLPAGLKEVNIKAIVKMKDGASKQMGSVRFRVKNVPKPLPLFGTKTGGSAKASEIQNTSYVTCGLGPEFAYEGLNYTITKYSLIYVPKKGDAVPFMDQRGNALSAQIKGTLSKSRRGDQIVVFNMEAQGPLRVGLVKLPSAIVLAVE